MTQVWLIYEDDKDVVEVRGIYASKAAAQAAIHRWQEQHKWQEDALYEAGCGFQVNGPIQVSDWCTCCDKSRSIDGPHEVIGGVEDPAPRVDNGSCPTCGSLSPWRCGCNDDIDEEGDNE